MSLFLSVLFAALVLTVISSLHSLFAQRMHPAASVAPAEHVRLAELYRSRAQACLEQSRRQEEMARQFRSHAYPCSSRYVSRAVSHYGFLAQHLRQRALKMQQLEQQHEKLAKQRGNI